MNNKKIIEELKGKASVHGVIQEDKRKPTLFTVYENELLEILEAKDQEKLDMLESIPVWQNKDFCFLCNSEGRTGFDVVNEYIADWKAHHKKQIKSEQ